MRINDQPVPWSFVEIQNITNKDGSELAPDNWRHKNIGMITRLILAGGILRLTPFFQIKIRMEEGKVVELDLDWEGNASTGPDWPVEVEPGIFDFETNTSIYRFRLLSEEEAEAVRSAVQKAIEARYAERFAMLQQMMNPPAGAGGGFPAS